MITMNDNDETTPLYEEVETDLEFDPVGDVRSKERLDGIILRAKIGSK